MFEQLLETSQPPVLTHGDLHHDNVLFSETKGWMAIDPKGIAAEPAYDCAALIRNPYKKIAAIEHLEELLKKRICILSEELGIDAKRIHQWCLAQTVLSGIWSSDSEEYASFSIKVARALERLSF